MVSTNHITLRKSIHNYNRYNQININVEFQLPSLCQRFMSFLYTPIFLSSIAVIKSALSRNGYI